MPTREEIAAWLNDAGDRTFDSWIVLLGAARAMEKVVRWYDRADQVLDMRCKTCKHWHEPNGLRSDYCSGLKWNEVDKMGPDFGCFYHEQTIILMASKGSGIMPEGCFSQEQITKEV